MNYGARLLVYLTVLRLIIAGLNTQSFPPVISAINPPFGGAEGGTTVSITGANISPGGLWSEVVIYFGNDICTFDRYHSDDNVIICTAPKCRTGQCLSSEGWNGYQSVNVMVFVTTVEGIVSASTTYQYRGGWTPSVHTMSHTTWATGTAFVDLFTYTSSLSDVTLTIGGHQFVAFSGASLSGNGSIVAITNQNAFTGYDNELNDETFSSLGSFEKIVYYYPPDDMMTGYYNLTVTLQNDFSTGSFSTGNARMYPVHKDTNTYYYFYNFDSTLSGTVYSLALLPVISSVLPSMGSVAGGTMVKISGFGFSREAERLTVYVGGVLCDVQSADGYHIYCLTRPGRSNLTSLLTSSHKFIDQHTVLNTTRGYGSPGWWIKMWNYDDYAKGRVGKAAYVKESFGWRQSSYFSLWNLYGSNWPASLGFQSQSSTYNYFASDMATVLTAPYTGYYTFYLCTDDAGDLYLSKTGVGLSEKRIATCSGYCNDGNFHKYNGQISRPYNFNKGERIFLRVRTVGVLQKFTLYVLLLLL